MAGDFQQTTVAATETPFLHESVNAVPGPREACISAAKVGNATLVHVQREAEFFRTYQEDWTPKFFAPEQQYSGQMPANGYDLGLAGAIIGAPADPEAFA